MCGGSAIDVELRYEGGRAIVTARGELDLSTLPRLREVLVEVASQPPSEVLVDLLEVSFLDAGTLGLLAGAAKRLRPSGSTLHVLVRPRQATLFHQSGLESLLEHHAE
jgi:anti-sigma B factor antagonist